MEQDKNIKASRASQTREKAKKAYYLDSPVIT